MNNDKALDQTSWQFLHCKIDYKLQLKIEMNNFRMFTKNPEEIFFCWGWQHINYID